MTVSTARASSPRPTTLRSVTRDGQTLPVTQTTSKRISDPPGPRLRPMAQRSIQSTSQSRLCGAVHRRFYAEWRNMRSWGPGNPRCAEKHVDDRRGRNRRLALFICASRWMRRKEPTMLDRVLRRAGLIARHRASLLGPWLDELADTLLRRGYTRAVVDGYIRGIVHFGRWLHLRGLGPAQIGDGTEMPGCISRGASARAGCGKSRSRAPPRGAPRLEARQRGGPRERAETNALRWRRRKRWRRRRGRWSGPIGAGEALAQRPMSLSGSGRTTSRPLLSRATATDCPCKARSAGVNRKTTKRSPSDTTA